MIIRDKLKKLVFVLLLTFELVQHASSIEDPFPLCQLCAARLYNLAALLTPAGRDCYDLTITACTVFGIEECNPYGLTCSDLGLETPAHAADILGVGKQPTLLLAGSHNRTSAVSASNKPDLVGSVHALLYVVVASTAIVLFWLWVQKHQGHMYVRGNAWRTRRDTLHARDV